LWEYKGRYIGDDIEALINEHDGITCDCFMGGDQNPQELNELIDCVHLKGLKVCLYTGRDDVPGEIHNLNYLKIGHYVEECGGLDKPTTNQKFYVVYDDKDYFDITSLFRKERIINVKDSQESR
jgi:anaerobic ribonucleoside-triphosphate reductase activating protein